MNKTKTEFYHWGNSPLETKLAQHLLEEILKEHCDSELNNPEKIRFAAWLFCKLAPMYGDNLLTERIYVSLVHKLKQVLQDEDYLSSFDKDEPIRVAIENQIADLNLAFKRVKNA